MDFEAQAVPVAARMSGQRAAKVDCRSCSPFDLRGDCIQCDLRLLFVYAASSCRLHVERGGAYAAGIYLEESNQARNLLVVAVMDRGIKHDRQRQSPDTFKIVHAQRVELDFTP